MHISLTPCPKATVVLSAGEAQVLRLIVEGSSNNAIATDLGISSEMVKTHMKSVLLKLKDLDRSAGVRVITEPGTDQPGGN